MGAWGAWRFFHKHTRIATYLTSMTATSTASHPCRCIRFYKIVGSQATSMDALDFLMLAHGRSCTQHSVASPILILVLHQWFTLRKHKEVYPLFQGQQQVPHGCSFRYVWRLLDFLLEFVNLNSDPVKLTSRLLSTTAKQCVGSIDRSHMNRMRDMIPTDLTLC